MRTLKLSFAADNLVLRDDILPLSQRAGKRMFVPYYGFGNPGTPQVGLPHSAQPTKLVGLRAGPLVKVTECLCT